MAYGVLCKRCKIPETAHTKRYSGARVCEEYIPDTKDARLKLRSLIEGFQPDHKDARVRYKYYTKITGQTVRVIEKKLQSYFAQLVKVPKAQKKI